MCLQVSMILFTGDVPGPGGMSGPGGEWSGLGVVCSQGGAWSGGSGSRGVPGSGVSAPGAVCSWEWGACSGGEVPAPGGVCLLPGGAWWRPPPGRLLLRVVRILLESILV